GITFINVLHTNQRGCSIVTDLHVASAPSMLTDGTEQMFFEKEIVQNGSSYLVKKLSSRSRFLNK
ncbi:hypothetical protein ONJ23_20435, partial [Salmonella enterica subsp. enterica serovar Virginia]|nr:hypothetical protein [Salmonella enterica subsp. enterica serovar Virginia]